jgi:hypothetical protein
MSAPTQITVSYISAFTNGIATASATVVISVPSALQTLDSTTPGVSQTGFSEFDVLLAAISKNFGVRFTDATGLLTFIPLNMITKITTP